MALQRPPAISAAAPTPLATAPTPLEDARAFNAGLDGSGEVRNRLEACVRKELHIEDVADVFLSNGHTTAHVHADIYFDGHLTLTDDVNFEQVVNVGGPIDFSAQGDIDLTGGDDDVFGRREDYGYEDGEDFEWPDDGGLSREETIARSRGYVPVEEYVAKSAEQRSAVMTPSLGGVGDSAPGMPAANHQGAR